MQALLPSVELLVLCIELLVLLLGLCDSLAKHRQVSMSRTEKSMVEGHHEIARWTPVEV